MPERDDVDGPRTQILCSLLRTWEWRLRLVAAIPAGILAGAWFGDEPQGWILDGIGFTAAFLVGVWTWLWNAADTSARGVLLADWGRTHDLVFEEFLALGQDTPLLREGDSQEATNGLVGELLGRPLVICHFTYSVVGVGDEGGTTHSDATFTVAQVSNVDTPVDGLVLHPTTSRLDRGLRKRRSSFPGGRVVALESASMHRGYKLEAREGVTETSIRRIFEPSFIEWCVDEGNVLFELEGGTLVVAVPYHLAGPSELVDLWARARWVLKRVTAASDRTPV